MQEPLGPFQEANNSISLREYGDVLRRRRAIILQTFVIVLVAGVLVTLFQPPTYQSTARLLIEPQQFFINQMNASDPLSELFRINQQYSIMTQVEMLQTPELKQEVAKTLGGNQRLPAMAIKPIEGTSIVEITSEGENPEAVASAPNTLMDRYIAKTKDDRQKEVDLALSFAKNQQKTYQEEATRLAEQIREFKNKHNIVELAYNKNEQMGLVTQLNGQVSNANQQRKLAEARIAETNRKMREMLAKNNNTRLMQVSPLSDPRFQDIDQKIFEISTQIEQARKTFTDDINLSAKDVASVNNLGTTNNPAAVANARAALNRMKNKLGKTDAETLKAQPEMTSLYLTLVRYLDRRVQLVQEWKPRNEIKDPVFQQLADQLIPDSITAKLLGEQERDLNARLADARRRLVQFPDWEAQYTRMQNQLDAAGKNLAYFASKIADLELRKTTFRETVSIMQKAETPTEPIRPKKAQNIIFAALLGLFFGLCLALLQELFDDRINSPEEAERVLRLPSLGMIPLIEEEGLRLIKDISTFSPLMEAYRSLRTNINFAAVGNQVRSIVVTSSVPAEGKSTTVANLAMAMAIDNKKVIIVDADLRRPSMHKLFRAESSPGLTDVLVGTHSIDEVIRPVPGVENVFLIPAGSPPPNPAELLGSAAMGHLIDSLEAMADVVLFDSPPALAVADAIVLASRANGVLLVVGYGETKKTSTKKAIETLARANANVLGTVLNRMEGSSSGYYYGKYYVPASERASTTRSATASAPALDQPSRALPDSEKPSGESDSSGGKGQNS